MLGLSAAGPRARPEQRQLEKEAGLGWFPSIPELRRPGQEGARSGQSTVAPGYGAGMRLKLQETASMMQSLRN